MRHKKTVGESGEDIAARYLSGRGYRIVEKNWSIREGEIDIIATKDEMLIFIEVKSRRFTGYGTGEEAITPLKKKRLINIAKAYLEYTGRNCACRFDVISVLFNERGRLKEINHIEEAFTL